MAISLNKYGHVIWDWNGTLINDTALCVEILNRSLRAYNLPAVTEETYRADFDFPVRDYYQRLGFDFSRHSFEKIAAEWIAEYEVRQFSCPLQPQARAVLQALGDRRFIQSILSAYHQQLLEKVIEHFQLTSFFEKIVGLTDYYAHGKSETGKRLLTELGCPPSEAVLIGDTAHDHAVASELGIDCILIADGHQPRAKLETCGRPVLDSLAQILDLLE
jgi:phosphoglycolate phosphatase